MSLMLGDRNFASAIQEFSGSLSGHSPSHAAGIHVRLTAGRPDHRIGGAEGCPISGLPSRSGSMWEAPRTRCVILSLEGGRLRFLGHGEVASTGWHEGESGGSAGLGRQRPGSRAASGVRSESGGGRDRGGGGRQQYRRRTTCGGLYEFGRPRAVTLEDMAYAVATRRAACASKRIA